MKSFTSPVPQITSLHDATIATLHYAGPYVTQRHHHVWANEFSQRRSN